MPEDENKIEEEKEVVYEEGNEKIAADAEKIRKKLRECREEKEKYLAGWQRAQADFINYKRRQEEQAAEWSRMYGEGLILNILPVLDSLDAAIVSQPKDQGLVTLRNQMQSVLKKHGLEEIKAIGEKFDPLLHEVVECEECLPEEKQEADIIGGEIQKGYLLNGKVLRVAKVKVKK
ncbi:MAG: nucleotide exchange factor GrpE [Candidatus Portnoybacteria bacterium RBG_13_41_18]|uniref:Protein GrpE n=1 Tax=Candidatus Portnoybacteria bacterium RBG_13_41_18 TaxID=1801991 RepID=A0A1G2F9G1_9BACT|nr:MAG: nucleotide exchange factor GrpE [Candidatus Portnoybacteria bacterium RBG_13_41_18]